jgi:metacaspase-1
MSKKALLVGINYPGTFAELKGCINDVNAMNSILTNNYGFSNNKMLTDKQATTKNILASLEWLISGAKAGDVLYFHFSGHGSQVVDTNNDESDRLDEIICPIDLNWKDKVIKDDDFLRIFSKLPKGVNLTVVLDCCHSGTGLRGGLIDPNAKVDRQRWLPAPKDILETIERGNLKPKPRALPQQKGILISGCSSSQTSADAWIGGKYMGACTYYLIDMLKRHKYKLDYNRLVLKMDYFIKKAGYTQSPQLNCDASLRGKLFLDKF